LVLVESFMGTAVVVGATVVGGTVVGGTVVVVTKWGMDVGDVAATRTPLGITTCGAGFGGGARLAIRRAAPDEIEGWWWRRGHFHGLKVAAAKIEVVLA
jgi:hypothetical protein